MLSKESEIRLSALVGWGSAIVALLVTDRISADPVNVSKMLALLTVSGAILGLMVSKIGSLVRKQKSVFLLTLGFFLSLLISVLVSGNPWERGIFGAYGRNTGLLTYLGLCILLFAVTTIRDESNVYRIIRAFMFVGFANIIYNLLVISGTDIFMWQNPYGKPIGTFGNPNFISSFMGMYATALLAILLFSLNSTKLKAFYIFQIPLSIYIIYKSGALQGFLVLGLGFSIVLSFYLRSRLKSLRFLAMYGVLILSSGFVAIAGMLQKGPLSSILYKPSVSFRGEYWSAGINMGLDKPFFGQGVDSYGTYYRLFRDPSALISPGASTVTDTAHNVLIDIFSGSGFFGLSFYVAIMALAVVRSVRYILRSKDVDANFVVLFTVWICYQAQSIISINQIGLAVWGWVFSGLLIGYPSIVRKDKPISVSIKGVGRKSKKKEQPEPNVVSAGVALSVVAGAVVGGLIALPAFLTDAQFRSAIAKSDAELVIAQASAFPMDTIRMNRAAVVLARGGLMQSAKDVATLATVKYPDDFAGWIVLYESIAAADPQRSVVKAKLHQLDPLNPEWK
jgi:O-antigen ligase